MGTTTLTMNKYSINKKNGKFNERVRVSAPLSYWKMNKSEIKKKYNGIGPDTVWMNIFPVGLRNSNFSLDIGEAGYIHDLMYSVDKTGWSVEMKENWKKLADDLFLENMTAYIKDAYRHPSWFVRFTGIRGRLQQVRMERAEWYYDLVHNAGDDYFNSDGDKTKLIIPKGLKRGRSMRNYKYL